MEFFSEMYTLFDTSKNVFVLLVMLTLKNQSKLNSFTVIANIKRMPYIKFIKTIPQDQSFI